MTNFGQPTTTTLNLDGGTLTTRGIIDEAGGTTTVNLNGGTLKPTMNHADLIDNVNTVLVGHRGSENRYQRLHGFHQRTAGRYSG
jgi:hypothetical protein